MNELNLTCYTVCRRTPEGGFLHGLPFVAMSDEAAKKMVIESLGKDIAKIDPSCFELRAVASFFPDAEMPVKRRCKSNYAVYPLGDIIAELVKTPLEVSDNAEKNI